MRLRASSEKIQNLSGEIRLKYEQILISFSEQGIRKGH